MYAFVDLFKSWAVTQAGNNNGSLNNNESLLNWLKRLDHLFRPLNSYLIINYKIIYTYKVINISSLNDQLSSCPHSLDEGAREDNMLIVLSRFMQRD